ncbi:MAG: hypothetical protein IPF79_01735 [Ignavibacteria bacterium]|nr:hypothetical protein [Ignavibacteria bacterium]
MVTRLIIIVAVLCAMGYVDARRHKDFVTAEAETSGWQFRQMITGKEATRLPSFHFSSTVIREPMYVSRLEHAMVPLTSEHSLFPEQQCGKPDIPQFNTNIEV